MPWISSAVEKRQESNARDALDVLDTESNRRCAKIKMNVQFLYDGPSSSSESEPSCGIANRLSQKGDVTSCEGEIFGGRTNASLKLARV